MNKPEVRAWRKSEITTYFFGMLNTIIQTEDENIHSALQCGDLQEAALCNAGLSAYKEILNVLPERLLEDASEVQTTT